MIQAVANKKSLWIRFTVLVMTLLLLVSCGGDLGCVAADDWGYPKITVPSHYDEGEVKGDGTGGSMQIAPPVDSDQIIIDAPGIIQMLMIILCKIFGQEMSRVCFFIIAHRQVRVLS